MNRSARGVWMIVGVVVALAIGTGEAQAQAAKRREDLAKVVEQINDPDPLMRIAYLEEVLARGNATEIRLAVKAALGGSDADLKSVALMAYVASLSDLFIDSRISRELEDRLAKGDANDAALTDIRHQLALWQARTGGRLQVRIAKMDTKTGKFNAYGMNELVQPVENYKGEGQVTGTRVRIRTTFINLRLCALDLAATPKLTLEGTATCNDMPPMLLSMPMY